MKCTLKDAAHCGHYGDDDRWEVAIDGERRELLSNSPTCCEEHWTCRVCGHVCDCQANDETGTRVLTTATREHADFLVQDGMFFVCEKCLRQAQ